MSNLNLKQVQSSVKAPMVDKPVKVLATTNDISEFIASQIEAPALNYTPINTNSIELKQYRLEDSDINKCYNDAGWTHIRLVDEMGEEITTPNVRLEVTHKSGKKYKIVPFFPLILTCNQSKLELKLESQLSAFSENGSLKARGGYKFCATPTQLDAMHEKAKLVWEAELKELILSFHSYLNGFTPTIELLPVLWEAFLVKALIIPFDDTIYVRQIIKDTEADTVQPLSNDKLELDTSSRDELLRCTNYTFKLVA